jgi:hypothetical protein
MRRKVSCRGSPAISTNSDIDATAYYFKQYYNFYRKMLIFNKKPQNWLI